MKPKPCLLIDDCHTCTFRKNNVLCELEGDDLNAFLKIKRSLMYEPHQTVFYEGHACLGLYLLCAGKVKLTRSSARGQRQIVRILDSGELIEKHAFCDKARHEVTCETMEPSQICVIEREPYLAFLRRNPELALEVIRLLCGELGVHMDRLDQFTFKSARERLAALLLDLASRYGTAETDGMRLGIRLKREELAELAGITVETVVRLLSAFQDEGLIKLNDKDIRILNRDRLSKIARQ